MNKKCVSEKGKPQWRRNEQWTSYEHYKHEQNEDKINEDKLSEGKMNWHKMNDEFLMTKTK